MDETAVRRQFDAIVERSGLRIPEDRRDTMLGTYRQVLTWSAMVRADQRPGTAEPSNAYSLDSITRLTDKG